MPNITISHAITYTKTGTTWSFAFQVQRTNSVSHVLLRRTDSLIFKEDETSIVLFRQGKTLQSQSLATNLNLQALQVIVCAQ